jgi:hypothetical protein
MADRIYKGKLKTIADDHFPEAASQFSRASAGGLVPFRLLCEILTDGQANFTRTPGSVHISSKGAWVTIDHDGTVEIGTSGV